MFIQIIKETSMLTSFVMVIMLLIEYLNIQTNERWGQHLKRSIWLQIPVATLMGLMPGCVGIFTVASLYTHGIIGFGALVAAMIATTGDEAFVMISTMPHIALKMSALLFVISLLIGYIVHYFTKDKHFNPKFEKHLQVHHHGEHTCIEEKESIVLRMRKITFERGLLLLGLTVFTLLLVFGKLDFGVWDLESWETVTFVIIALAAFVVVATVPEHFLLDHLWNHVFRSHLIRIFLWTFAALLFIHLIDSYINVEQWIKTNQIWVLILALLIGIIPQSGPHLVFITLFLSGSIPFSILLANSIVQDGHGSLILLAESKKSFVYGKLVCIAVGLIFGVSGYLFGF